MNKAIILHGTGGAPEGNWFRWLELELQKRNITTWLPKLPNADNPNLITWLGFVAEQCPFNIDDKTILIGHSSGATLALLLSLQKQVGRMIAVAPFVPMDYPYPAVEWEANEHLFDGIEINGMFSRHELDDTQRMVLYSDDDPYIPRGVPEHIANTLKISRIMLSGQGHFNLEKGSEFSELPILVSFIGDDWPFDNLPQEFRR